MLAIKRKKATKPTDVISAMTFDAGRSRVANPANTPTKMPSHPIHLGATEVLRIATAKSGTATPQASTSPV